MPRPSTPSFLGPVFAWMPVTSAGMTGAESHAMMAGVLGPDTPPEAAGNPVTP
jgi:hypothetical protein